jgi:hypothetical protein
MLTPPRRFRLWIGIAAALGGSQLAGCCGSIFAEDVGCGSCGERQGPAMDCPESDAAADVIVEDVADTGSD